MANHINEDRAAEETFSGEFFVNLVQLLPNLFLVNGTKLGSLL